MVVELTDETFAEFIKSDDPVLIDFTATWCPPCKTMKPLVEELSMELELKIAAVDADSCPAAMQAAGVMAVPTFIVYQKGEIVRQVSGGRSKSDLRKFVTGAWN